MENVFILITILNLNFGDKKKNKPSLCDVFDMMREVMCKLLKKSFLAIHSCKNLMRMNAKSKSKGAHTFCIAHWTIIGES